MNRIYRKIFLYSLYLYLGSTLYTRIEDSHFSLPEKILYSMPLDAFPLKYLERQDFVSSQIGVLSKSEVVDLLKTTPDSFPHIYEGTTLKQIKTTESTRDYVVLRFKNTEHNHHGKVKLYYSFFPYSIVHRFYFPWAKPDYCNVILPYPHFLEPESHNPSKLTSKVINF